MSLNSAQRKQTSIELKANYDISELTPDDIKRDLGLNDEELEITLNLGIKVNPETVWRLRDYLEDKIKEMGKNPYPYSVLKINIYYRYK